MVAHVQHNRTSTRVVLTLLKYRDDCFRKERTIILGSFSPEPASKLWEMKLVRIENQSQKSLCVLWTVGSLRYVCLELRWQGLTFQPHAEHSWVAPEVPVEVQLVDGPFLLSLLETSFLLVRLKDRKSGSFQFSKDSRCLGIVHATFEEVTVRVQTKEATKFKTLFFSDRLSESPAIKAGEGSFLPQRYAEKVAGHFIHPAPALTPTDRGVIRHPYHILALQGEPLLLIFGASKEVFKDKRPLCVVKTISLNTAVSGKAKIYAHAPSLLLGSTYIPATNEIYYSLVEFLLVHHPDKSLFELVLGKGVRVWHTVDNAQAVLVDAFRPGKGLEILVLPKKYSSPSSWRLISPTQFITKNKFDRLFKALQKDHAAALATLKRQQEMRQQVLRLQAHAEALLRKQTPLGNYLQSSVKSYALLGKRPRPPLQPSETVEERIFELCALLVERVGSIFEEISLEQQTWRVRVLLSNVSPYPYDVLLYIKPHQKTTLLKVVSPKGISRLESGNRAVFECVFVLECQAWPWGQCVLGAVFRPRPHARLPVKIGSCSWTAAAFARLVLPRYPAPNLKPMRINTSSRFASISLEPNALVTRRSRLKSTIVQCSVEDLGGCIARHTKVEFVKEPNLFKVGSVTIVCEEGACGSIIITAKAPRIVDIGWFFAALKKRLPPGASLVPIEEVEPEVSVIELISFGQRHFTNLHPPDLSVQDEARGEDEVVVRFFGSIVAAD